MIIAFWQRFAKATIKTSRGKGKVRAHMSFYEDAWAFCVSINKIATHTLTHVGRKMRGRRKNIYVHVIVSAK